MLWICLLICLSLTACGGGGGSPAEPTSSLQSIGAAVTPTSSVAALPAAAAIPAAPAAAPADSSTPAVAATSLSLQPPSLPRAALTAGELAVVIAEGDATSEAIALAYQRARGIPDAHMIRVRMPTGADAISAADFALLKAAIDAKLPAAVQATLLTFNSPSRVQGASCTMGITSAMAFGYDARWCGQCSRTQASSYYDSDSTRPWSELGLRPSMMLGASTLAAAQALIDRGVAADGSQPAGTGYLVRTTDSARSVRFPDFQLLPAAWSEAPALALRYVDASAAGSAQTITSADDVLFHFTGLAQVAQIASNRYLPGAVADHLTSFGGLLPAGNGQMPITAWLTAGATASFGTVEEPCNYTEKFAKVSVLIDHYLRGATLIEAYWKSVAWPGQGLFVGEPLARPWPDAAQAVIEGSELVIRTRSLRRHGQYRVEHRASAADSWRTLAALSAGQPRLLTWRVPLPTGGGELRWVGPCATQPAQTCTLGLAS
ncbi:MAG: TIGR03790 family protein [Rubrivivax sp.]|nr:TIGR03790 family protein [Rubrivivax sp.]